MNILRSQPKPVLAMHMQGGCFTLIKLVAEQGEWHLVALTQSPSLSQFIETVKEHQSSRLINNLFCKRPILAISLTADNYQRLTLSLPLHLKVPEVLPTLRWLLEQQGFTPMDQWQWDYQISDTEDSVSADVMLVEKSVLIDMLQTLGLSLAKLTLICPTSDLHDFSEPAAGLLEQHPPPGPLLNLNAADTCIRTALAAAGVRHV